MNVKQLNNRVIKLLEELKITSEALNEGKKREVLSDEEYAKFILSYMHNDPTYEELLNMLPMINDDLYLEEIKTIKRPKLKSLYKKAVELKKQTNESLDGDTVTVVNIPLVTEKLYNKLVNVLYGDNRGKNRDYEQQGNVLNFLQEIEDRIPLGGEFHTDLEDYGFTTDEINAIKKIVREERVNESLNEAIGEADEDLYFSDFSEDELDALASVTYEDHDEGEGYYKIYNDVVQEFFAESSNEKDKQILQSLPFIKKLLTNEYDVVTLINDFSKDESLNESSVINNFKEIVNEIVSNFKTEGYPKSNKFLLDFIKEGISTFHYTGYKIETHTDNGEAILNLIDMRPVAELSAEEQPDDEIIYQARINAQTKKVKFTDVEGSNYMFNESLKGYKEVAKIIKNDKGYNVAQKDEPMLVEDKSSLKSLLTELAKYL